MANLTSSYLITGAAGFIGARTVESCGRRGIPVISVDDLQVFNLRPEHKGLDFGIQIDREELFDWLEKNHPKLGAIIHLGAITDTRESDLKRLNHFNLNYSQALWSYASTHQVPFLYASSAATYGDGKLGYDDNEAIIPQLQALNAYGDSKQKFDLWALEQERQGNHPPYWSGYKFFNVYGFGERHKDFMASVVLHAYDQMMTSGEVTLFKSHREGIPDGHQKRDFVSVEDIVEALHFAIEKPIRRGIYNLGTGQARTFLDLARAVFKALNRPEQIRFIDMPVILRDKYQYFTEAKMDRFRAQGYTRPFSTLEEGVTRYVHRLQESS